MAEQSAVRVNYQLTLEDYSEANRAHAGNRPWLSWPYFGAIAIYPLFLNVIYSGDSQQPPGNQQSSFLSLIGALLPLIVCMGVTMVATIKISRLNGQPWRRGKRAVVSVRAGTHAKLFTFISVAVACIGLLIFRIYRALGEENGDPTRSPVVQAIAEMIPGVVIAGFFLVLFFFFGGDRFGRAWQLQTNLHRPISLKVDDNVVVVTEVNCQSRNAWAYFAGYLESPNLFLIYVNALSFQIVPKRAFVDESQLELLRSRLKRYISEQPSSQLQTDFPLMAIPLQSPVPPSGASTPPPLPIISR